MNTNCISPYIRVAMKSILTAPFCIGERIIFDYELILIDDGEFLFTIDGQDYICKKDTVIFIRPNHPHRFDSIENQNLSQPHIHFDPVYDEKSEERFVCFKPYDKLTDFEKGLILTDIFKDIPIHSVIRLRNITYFKVLFYNLIELSEKKSRFMQLEYKQKMIQLLLLLLEEADCREPEEPNINQTMAYIKSYIDTNFINRISLKMLSGQFHLSMTYLSEKFRQAYGFTVMEYYANLRLETAKRLLCENEKSVSEISEFLHFDNIYTFSRFFKNKTGISPKEFRKKYILTI